AYPPLFYFRSVIYGKINNFYSFSLLENSKNRLTVKHHCTGNPPVERIDPTSNEGRAEVADFLWPATERALHTYASQPLANHTAAQMWPLIPSNHRLEELRREQQQSYMSMKQLIEEYMLPEKLFGEHLGQPCLIGRSEGCWNGRGFEE
ncbi:unnamed protein product, partial [Hymenolepis diminuta]